ncbi:hypothetical protein PC39_09600 [Salinisphaera sp. PC39]|uniref:DUF4845 domain-containing protein n=1 Tax=Salinisphaera sp. PC39 TaxID=1304156 RepID=UPI00333FE96E
MMTGHPDRQRGLTLWGWLYVLATLGVILMVGIKAVPIYMNNYDIRSTLQWASSQPELRDAPAFEIQERIQRRFDSGYVDNISGRDIKVERVDNGRRLSVEYEVREPLFANLTLLFEFHETAVIPRNP